MGGPRAWSCRRSGAADSAGRPGGQFRPGGLVAAERPGLDPQLGLGPGDLSGHGHPASRARPPHAARKPACRERDLTPADGHQQRHAATPGRPPVVTNWASQLGLQDMVAMTASIGTALTACSCLSAERLSTCLQQPPLSRSVTYQSPVYSEAFLRKGRTQGEVLWR